MSGDEIVDADLSPHALADAKGVLDAQGVAEARLAQRRGDFARLERTELGWANRSAFVLLAGLLLIPLSGLGVVPFPVLYIVLAMGVLLVPMVWVRRRWSERRTRAGYAVDWYTRARARLNEDFDFGQDQGTGYQDRAHPFAYDLDLFGPGSLFGRVNACHTPLGQDELARWLGDVSPDSGAAARAAAIAEVRERLTDREALEIELRSLAEAGRRHTPAVLAARTRELLDWGAQPVVDAGPSHGERTLVRLLPVAALAGAALSLGLGWSAAWGLAPYLINVYYARRFRDLSGLTERFEGVADTLHSWSQVLGRISGLRFQSDLLSSLIAAVATPGSPAPAAVAELRRHAHRLAQRQNAYWALTGNVLLLSDVRARRALLEWQRKHGPHLTHWMGAVAQLEALLSLASYADSVPDSRPAELDEAGPLFEAQTLAHALLPRTRRVANDLRLPEVGALIVVTGSNMSGKSTYLRAAGLAVVLARAGLPVPASSVRLRTLGVVTSMNVEDSLKGGLSRFHAEVRRLRFCLDQAQGQGPVLVLLDEILAGTNSRERHLGTEAVLRQLAGLPTATLVSTHDLSLAGLGQDPTLAARVVHFTDEVKDGLMTFDYRLREGPLPSTNALEVMRLEGIQVQDSAAPSVPETPE